MPMWDNISYLEVSVIFFSLALRRSSFGPRSLFRLCFWLFYPSALQEMEKSVRPEILYLSQSLELKSPEVLYSGLIFIPSPGCWRRNLLQFSVSFFLSFPFIQWNSALLLLYETIFECPHTCCTWQTPRHVTWSFFLPLPFFQLSNKDLRKWFSKENIKCRYGTNINKHLRCLFRKAL